MFKVGDKVRVKNYSEFEKDFLKVENSYTVFYHTIKSISINRDMIALTLGKTLVISEKVITLGVAGVGAYLSVKQISKKRAWQNA